MHKLLVAFSVILALVGTASADMTSANAVMPGCRAVLSNSEASQVTPGEAWDEGYCAGIIAGLVDDAEFS